MGTEISIAFATDDNYAQHTAVAMASIMNNTNKNNKTLVSKERPQRKLKLKKIINFVVPDNL